MKLAAIDPAPLRYPADPALAAWLAKRHDPAWKARPLPRIRQRAYRLTGQLRAPQLSA